ncbi:hypothetical protein PGTUg99_001488 [Puccinia graminis f. sp. tritici]|uniref:CCZ1/INTU/HSP4 first Longin domain-containing protein n=1 Tax=Puccinia graminis f. sp. tritici TaxID=56615 RepID=A0A5B0RQT4_PUCGR|nr:hypothetical protein PGTUg99_001488 [Puccinia graminis f. sp. tritici]
MTSKLSDTFNILSQQQGPSSNYEPSESVLLNSLSSAAQEYHLLHGSMSLLLPNKLHALRERLEKFWSVWLWRWNVGKTGCGAVDFNELFGGLQSPFLESPKMPRAPVDLFARFVNHVCPAFSVLPILIHDRKVLHIPCPIGMIKQEDIQTLVRYLLSLLEGSEAKRVQVRPVAKVKVVEPEQNVIMKRLSGFDFGTLASLQPKLASTTNLAIQPASAWAHKAFKWASTSLVLPSNLFENIENESESLDQLLRADIGLPPRTSPPQLVRIKSSLSDPKVVAQSVPSPTRLGSQTSPSSTVSSRTKLGYPHNLLAIYPQAHSSHSRGIHYPDSLLNLYGSMAVSDSPEEETGIHSLPTVPQDPARSSEPPTKADSTGEKVTPSSLGQSKHNPRSPSFNVEHALADAMSERSIGSIAALEFVRSQSFTEFPRSDSSDPSRPSSELPPSDTLVLEPDQPNSVSPDTDTPVNAPLNRGSATIRSPSTSDTTALKQLQVYVNSGKSTSSVSWLQIDGWTLAWLAQPSDPLDSSSQLDEGSDVVEKEPLLKQARYVLDSLIQSKWPEESEPERPEQQRTAERVTRGTQMAASKVSRQRFMIKDDHSSTGLFIQQAGPQSGWLSKNEIWPGKTIPPSEVEVHLGLLRLLDDSLFGRVGGSSELVSHSGISLFEEGFLRTKSGQWIISKRIPHHHHHHLQRRQKQKTEGAEDAEEQPHSITTSQVKTDTSDRLIEAFLVLPAGFGSLIEADSYVPPFFFSLSFNSSSNPPHFSLFLIAPHPTHLTDITYILIYLYL